MAQMSAIPSSTNENPTHCASVKESNTALYAAEAGAPGGGRSKRASWTGL
jgi:hypothetical protein